MELSLRHQIIVRLKCAGASHKEIASQLGTSEHAISVSLAGLYKKFGVRNGAEFVATFQTEAGTGTAKSQS